MKKVLLFIILCNIFLISCSGNSEERLNKKFNKELSEYTGYETELELKIIKDKKDSLYKLKEVYINNDEINIEILEPEKNNEITIHYKGDNLYFKNTSIDQSISLQGFKELNKELLFADIFSKRDTRTPIREDLENKEYYIIEKIVENSNKHNKKKIIYLNKNSFTPAKMIILDKDNKERVVIKYSNFNYIKN